MTHSFPTLRSSGLLVLPIPIYGTHWILLLAYVAIHLPFAVRICSSGLAQLHPELEEAGLVAGAGRTTVMRRIVLLLVLPSILARSEEHTSELQSLMRISYAVFCLQKQKQKT